MKRERFKLIPAVYLMLRRGDEILLAQRANTGYQDGKYSIPAGHLDGDELGVEGIIREAKEEIGIILKPGDLRFAHVAHRLNRGKPNEERLDLFFEAWHWEGEIKIMEPEKCGDLKWAKIDELPDEILPLVKLVIRDVSNEVRYSEHITEPL